MSLYEPATFCCEIGSEPKCDNIALKARQFRWECIGRGKRGVGGGGGRVAWWYIFEPKIPILVNFGGSFSGRCWYVLRPFGLFYVRLVYFMALRYIFGHLVYFPPFWYVVPRQIWQPWWQGWRGVVCTESIRMWVELFDNITEH
jgi:hypothetical protein